MNPRVLCLGLLLAFSGLPACNCGNKSTDDGGASSPQDAGTTPDASVLPDASSPADSGSLPDANTVADAAQPPPDGGTRDAAVLPDASAADAAWNPGDGGTAVIPATHPRVFLTLDHNAGATASLLAMDPAALRFKTLVDTEMQGAAHYNFQAWNAALLYQLTNDTTYADYAVGLVDAFVTSEEALINANMRPTVSGDSYLEVGDFIGNLALVYDWCFERLTPQQKQRWLAYANQAVWNVWHPDEAVWNGTLFTWSGWSINNPVNNYYYSFLRATLLLGLAAHGELGDAAAWVEMFRTTKIGQQLAPVFLQDLGGGGSREGTGYGTAMRGLFELYIIWQGSTGEAVADLTPHARASIPYLIHATSTTLAFLSPIGDHARDSTGALFDYHRNYLQALLHLFPQDPVAPLAQRYLLDCSVPEMGQGFNFYSDFLYLNAAVTPAASLGALSTGYHGTGTGHVFVRSGWDTNATWLTFIAGPYTESHAHHDQGSFTLFKGDWLAYDQNYNSHSGIHQEEEVHNLVRITQNGTTVTMRESAPPSELVALYDSAEFAYGAADTTPIYDGQEPVQHVDREWVFIKPGILVVMDRVDTGTAAAVIKTWQLNVPVAPQVNGGVATVSNGGAQLVVHQVLPGSAYGFSPWTSLDADMVAGYRLDVQTNATGQTVFLNVLVVDGAASSVTAQGNAGVTVGLTGGGSAEVVFNTPGMGGTLTLTNASNQVLHQGALPTGVQAWPVMHP